MVFKEMQGGLPAVRHSGFQVIAVHYLFQQFADGRVIVHNQYFVSHSSPQNLLFPCLFFDVKSL
jgi:hypothetical protein